MTTEIVKIDPKEYGLQDEQVKIIEAAFMPKIAERDGIKPIYEEIIAAEITRELCKRAKDLRIKLVKVRTGIAEIHKTQKAFYLAAGRYVDAWKNKETLPVTQMEESLTAIEEHYERIEAAQVQKLQDERTAEIQKYSEEGVFVPGNLGSLDASVYANYLLGVKTAYERRIAAEKQAEVDRIAKEKAEAEERERIRLDNIRLQKEAKAAEEARELAEKKARKEREDAERKLVEERERAEKAAEAERKKQAEILAKQKAEANTRQKEIEDRARKEQGAREKAEAELAAKAEAERKAKEAEEVRLQMELAKGDADKVIDLITDLKTLKGKYTFKSKKNQKMYSDTGILLDKIVNFISAQS